MPLRRAAHRAALALGAGALVAGALVAAPHPLGAQSQLSEHALVAQTVAGTTVTVAYSRPQLRGRDSVFGPVVKWDRIWTPGANWATTLDVDRDVLVEGKRLARGTYSVWAVPRPDRWTLTLHRKAKRFHIQRPDSTDEVLRVDVRPDSGAPVEALTWDFPTVGRDATTLRLRWARTVVPLRIAAVPAPAPLLRTVAERAPYLGAYDVERAVALAGMPPRYQVQVYAAGDSLRLRVLGDPGADTARGIDLLPAGRARFIPAEATPDGPLNFARELIYTFDVAGGQARGFEVRMDDGTLFTRGRRRTGGAGAAAPRTPAAARQP